MPVRKSRPAYTEHKPTGQARVRMNGRDHYLGEYNSPESRDRYNDLMQEWLITDGDVSRYTLTIDDLALMYLAHAKTHYKKNGKQTSEVKCIKTALRFLLSQYGTKRARDFGPKALKKVRDSR